MKAVIVLPTYNEIENINRVIPQILTVFKDIKNHDMNILVVDDNSPDGTANEVKKYQKKHKNIHLLKGNKQGLGVAYLRGFKYTIDKLKAEVIFEMDADLSHPPKLIKQFMKEIDNGYDVVIGSRYIKGGDTPDWPFKRKMISAGGNFFARFVAGLYGVNDCTSGYRAIRVASYKKINPADIMTKGYAFQITLLYELLKVKAKVKQVPLIFPDRKYGVSKIGKNDISEFFVNVFRLRIKSMKRLIKFGLVGLSGVFVNLFLLYLFVDILNWNKKILSPILAVEISIIWNFIFNDKWTFKKSKVKDSWLVKLVKFNLVSLVGLAINLVIYNLLLLIPLLLHIAGRFDYLVAQFIAICFVFIWNYVINVKWTWKK